MVLLIAGLAVLVITVAVFWALLTLTLIEVGVFYMHIGRVFFVTAKNTLSDASRCLNLAKEHVDLIAQVLGVTDSPITGADGNKEFLISARRA